MEYGTSINRAVVDHKYTIHFFFIFFLFVKHIVKKKETSRYYIVDFGWTISTCQSRGGSTSGVALPRLKPNTETPVVTKLFTGASTILRELEIPWIDSNQDNIFLDSSEPNRRLDFQERIATGNIVEAIHVAKSNSSELCGAHEDTQNSTKPTMSAVFCISKVLCNNDGYSLISYGRKLIDVASQDAIHVDPFTKAIANFYSSIEVKKQTITTDLLQGNETSPIPNFPLPLIKKFDLNLVEIVSVVTCYEIFPHCLYYFGVAANIFLIDISPKDKRRFCGSFFGYQLYKVMMHVFHSTRQVRSQNIRKKLSSTNTTLPPPSFQCYTSLEIVTSVQSFPLWEERCNHKLHTILMFNNKYWTTRNQPTMKTAYKKLIKELNPHAPNCGSLSLQHELAIMSSLGLLPLWVFSFATVDSNGKPMEHIQNEFACIVVADEKKRTSTIITLTTVLNKVFNLSLTIRDIENIICKAF
eukprot:scaffold218637_cov51-Attheya_sp.AAC.1